jgi:Na+/proline symporter
LLAVTQGAAILLAELTDLTYVQGLIVAWLSYTLFTMYSGSRGVILTDTIMFLLFTIASTAATVFLVKELGGVPAIDRGGAGRDRGKDGSDVVAWHGWTRYRMANAYGLPDLGHRHRYQLDACLHGESLAIQSTPDGAQ